MAFRFPACESCYFHDYEPSICEECEDESEYEPNEDTDEMSVGKYFSLKNLYPRNKLKEAA